MSEPNTTGFLSPPPPPFAFLLTKLMPIIKLEWSQEIGITTTHAPLWKSLGLTNRAGKDEAEWVRDPTIIMDIFVAVNNKRRCTHSQGDK